MATVGRGAEQYTVRFPDGLRDRIKAAAEANGRSMNAEIVAALEYWAEKGFREEQEGWEKYISTLEADNTRFARRLDELDAKVDQMIEGRRSGRPKK